jgi:hypothetical protein
MSLHPCAGRLGYVHGCVCATQQPVHVVGVVGIGGDTDARVDVQRHRAHGERLPQQSAQTDCNGTGVGQLRVR